MTSTLLSVGPARLLDPTIEPQPVAAGDWTRDRLIMLTRQVGLLGRGGAAFPVATKLAATPSGRGTVVVVNGSESEPASFKDRALMRSGPHLVVEGALVVAAALGTRRVQIAVHDRESASALTSALTERSDSAQVQVTVTEPGFVTGEARALVATLSGRPAVPSGRRILPSVSGVDGRPSFVSNVETFAQIGLLARHGAAWFAGLGSPEEPGTSLVTLLGDVPTPGVVEVPNGTSLELLTGSAVGPVLMGGYHGTWGSVAGALLDRVALRAAGVSWGAGVVAVLPDTTCALGEVARVTRWLAGESAGQCGPCVFGLASIADDLELLVRGEPVDLDRFSRRVGLVRGRGACAHPDGAVGFVASALRAFGDEVERHHLGHGCGRPVQGVLPIGGVR